MRPQFFATTAPPRWALSPWARLVRRATWRWEVARHVGYYCSPLRVEGAHHFSSVPKPVIIIPNHASHFDTVVALHVIPPPLRSRTAIAAAADRFYQTWWRSVRFSLRYNAFPIERGGGRRALDYADELIERGWSLVIYPEGHRSRDGRVQPFHHGVSILALQHRVPVLPVYMHGTAAIIPVGTKNATGPVPVTVTIGEPVLLDPSLSITEGTAVLEEAMRALERRFLPEPGVEVAAVEGEPVAVS